MSKVVIAVLAFLIARLLPRRKDRTSTINKLVARLPNANYDALCEFTPNGARRNDPDFWGKSKGVAGMLQRLYSSILYLVIAYLLFDGGRIGRREAWCILKKFVTHGFFTLIGLIEAVIFLPWKLPRQASRKALGHHFDMVIGINTLWPECLSPICELL